MKVRFHYYDYERGRWCTRVGTADRPPVVGRCFRFKSRSGGHLTPEVTSVEGAGWFETGEGTRYRIELIDLNEAIELRELAKERQHGPA